MTEFVEPFCGVDGAFTLPVEKLIPILDLIPWGKLNLWYMVLYGHMND